nr:glycosyltransferase [Brevibacillus fulvus]
MSTADLVSVIIPARNEEQTIAKVVEEAKQIAEHIEIVVISNGTKDRTAQLAQQAGARVIQMDASLGHDVGRAVGAYFAKGNILLFIDADFVIPAYILRKYVEDVQQGWDIVLNSYSGNKTKKQIHSTSVAKRLLNKMLGRPDLVGSSLTTVPHALNRKAVEVIGYADLAIPPKAQVKAVLNQLKIKRAHFINTARFNKRRVGRREDVISLVLGDHLEAICYLLDQRGSRAELTDFLRKRELLRLPGENHLRWIYGRE